MMRAVHVLVFLGFGAVLLGMGHAQEPSIRSQQLIVRYYDAPTAARRLEAITGGRSVVICTDDCERFEVALGASSGELWDGVLIFKAFLSGTRIDEAFRDENMDYAAEVLRRRSNGCTGGGNERTASCALKLMAKTVGFRVTRVVFDEGNRCESTWTFDEQPRLLSSRCSKVSRPLSEPRRK